MQRSMIEDQVWALLRFKGLTYKKTVMPGGAVVESGIIRKDVNKMVLSTLDSAVKEIVLAYDWNFAYDEATTTSVADQADYTFEGNNSDCRDIINIRWGDSETVLDELNFLQDDRRTEGTEGSNVYGYILFKREDNFPVVTIRGTPDSAETIKYRYRRKDITLAELPDSFDIAVVDQILKRWDRGWELAAETSLNKLIARYKIGGDRHETIRMNPAIEDGNFRRKGLQGGV